MRVILSVLKLRVVWAQADLVGLLRVPTFFLAALSDGHTRNEVFRGRSRHYTYVNMHLNQRLVAAETRKLQSLGSGDVCVDEITHPCRVSSELTGLPLFLASPISPPPPPHPAKLQHIMSFLHRTPSPSAVPATPAQTHAPPPTAIDPSAETSSFLDRMHETFHPSHQQTQAQAPLAPALPPQAHHQDAGRPKAEEDSLLDKLTSKLSLSDSHPAPPVAPPAAPVHTASSSSGFLHRLADKLESSGDKEAAAAVPVSPAPPRKADGTIWDGLGFGGSDRPATPPPAPKGTLERLGDKVKDAVGAGGEEKKDKHAVPSAKKGEGLLAKLNEAAGGGVSGEERGTYAPTGGSSP